MFARATLSKDEKLKLEDQVRASIPPYSRDHFSLFREGCRNVIDDLDQGIMSWRDETLKASVGLLRNLPIGEDVPLTPTVRGTVDAVPMFSDGIIGVLSALFGNIYILDGKVGGRHIHNVYPCFGDEDTQLGSSSAELQWHVEDAFHPYRASWIGLLCVREDASVVTKVARVRDMELSEEDRRALAVDEYSLLVDESFSPTVRGAVWSSRVLSGPESDPSIVFDPAYTIFRDAVQRDCFQRVLAAAEASHRQVVLQRGDFLALDNRRTIHARSRHAPRMDGGDRWIKRTLILQDGIDVTWTAPGILAQV
jgi:L-asparagine oxygenase